MAIPQVVQLRFTRNKWLAGLEGVTEEDALTRIEPMNSIGWMVGHLASHEHIYWIMMAQDRTAFPELRQYGTGQPGSTPPLAEMMYMWREVAAQSEAYLDSLTVPDLLTHLKFRGNAHPENIGTFFMRLTYHYWYHLGEMQAVRQMLGHKDLPDFVGQVDPEFMYAPEGGDGGFVV